MERLTSGPENGKRYLRLRSQASRDGRTRVPLKRRKEGEGRNVPVPDYVWDMVPHQLRWAVGHR